MWETAFYATPSEFGQTDNKDVDRFRQQPFVRQIITGRIQSAEKDMKLRKKKIDTGSYGSPNKSS